MFAVFRVERRKLQFKARYPESEHGRQDTLPIILRNNYRLTGPCNSAGERNKVVQGTGQKSLVLVVVDCSVPVVCFASVAKPVQLVNDRDPGRVHSSCSVIASWLVPFVRFSVCHRVPRERKRLSSKRGIAAPAFHRSFLVPAMARLFNARSFLSNFSSLYQLPRPLSLLLFPLLSVAAT